MSKKEEKLYIFAYKIYHNFLELPHICAVKYGYKLDSEIFNNPKEYIDFNKFKDELANSVNIICRSNSENLFIRIGSSFRKIEQITLTDNKFTSLENKNDQIFRSEVTLKKFPFHDHFDLNIESISYDATNDEYIMKQSYNFDLECVKHFEIDSDKLSCPMILRK